MYNHRFSTVVHRAALSVDRLHENLLKVRPVRIDELLTAIAARGIELTRFCHELTRSSARARLDITELFFVSGATAGRWLNLAGELFRTLDDASETAFRNQAITLAGGLGLSIDALLTVNTALRYLHADAPTSKEVLRCELHELAAGRTIDDIKAIANARVRDLNDGLSPTTNRTRRYFRASRTTDALGMRHAHIYLPEDTLAALERRLHERAVEMRKADEDLTHQQAMVDALVENGSREGASPWLQPAVLISADDLENRGDGTFATTDGTLLTAAEYVAQRIAPYGLCLLYDAESQPVDLFRTARYANDKQRAMINLDQLLCAEPHCTHTAATSQAHHVTAWENGGNTNFANLVGACAQHNAQNDDKPSAARNGSLTRCPETGQAGWRPPGGGPMKFNRRPIMSKSGRAWALSAVRK